MKDLWIPTANTGICGVELGSTIVVCGVTINDVLSYIVISIAVNIWSIPSFQTTYHE